MTLWVKFPAIVSASPADTARLGAALARHVYPGLLILLYGPLGAGKTNLASAIGAALGAKNVKSPTFTIESVHRLPNLPFTLVHADLYRLSDSPDAAAQFEEYLDDGEVVVVEWAERWRRPPSGDRWDILFSFSGVERTLVLSAFGERALAALSQAFEEVLML